MNGSFGGLGKRKSLVGEILVFSFIIFWVIIGMENSADLGLVLGRLI